MAPRLLSKFIEVVMLILLLMHEMEKGHPCIKRVSL